MAAADTTATDTTSEAGKSSSTTTAGASSGINNYAVAGLIGLGAIGVAAAASSGGGGGGHTNPSGPTADTTSPTLTTTNRNNSAQTITLTFSENLDPAHLPASSALTISLNNNPVFSAIPMGSTIAIGAANQLVITLPMGTFTAGDTIAIRYTDPSAANDSNALQDAAGNDIANFMTTSFSVIDGYVRNAKIYIDTNGNGIAENSEFTGVVTDENGNFFLPANRPAGAIIATGGVNIDTGVANTIEFKAPTESTVLTPLTTLIQAYIAANKVDAANAENAIKAALGIPDNIDLLNYDPLAEASSNTDALAVQKTAASIATIISLAAGSNNVLENTVISNLVTAIKDANNSTSTIDLTDNNTLNTIISNTGTNVQTVSDATTAINNAGSLQEISDAQSEALDNISPAIPTLLRLSDSTDTGIKGDATTNISNSTIRVSFNITATDGTAAVAGDNITIYNGSNPVGATNLTATDISNGYADIHTQLSPGNNSLTAQITDAVFHKSAFSTATVFVLDNTPPNTPSISLVKDSTDGANGHDADGITNNANLVFSTAAADVTRTYAINGVANNSYVAPTIDGTYTVLVTDTDTAGNASSSSITFMLDTSATAPVWTNATGGVLGADGTVSTNDSTPAIGGTAEAGVTINIYNALGSANLPEGALLGTVIAGADGKWSLQLPQLPDGDYRARAEAVDAAGNVSALAVGPLLRVDSTIAVPTITLVADSTDGANGHDSDKVTNNANLVFSTAAADVTRTYAINGVANNSTASGSYVAPTTDGTYTVLVTDTDTAGNTSSASITFMLDTSATATPTVALTSDSTDGTTGHDADSITNNANLVFSTAAADVTRTYAINGVANNSYVAPTIDGTYTVLVTDTDVAGNTASANLTFNLDTTIATPAITLTTNSGNTTDNITNDASLTFSTAATDVTRTYAINNSTASGSYVAPTTDGTYTVLVTDTDAAGNTSSASITFMLDTSATATPTVALTSDSTDGANGHDSDKVTNNANLVFSTAAADVTRTYAINGVANNSYFAPTIDGTYTVLVTDTDAAGNTSSSSITFKLDTSATAPVWTNATGGVLGADGTVSTNDSTPAIGGTAEAGVTINIYNALGSANLPEGALLGTVIAGADGKWSLQLPQLPDGDYRARAEAVDAAGNVSALAVGPLLRVDTTNNPADIAQPYVVSASFTEGANAIITLTYSEPMQIVNTTPYYPWSGINITGASVVNNTITLTTDKTLTATDIVELDPYGSLYLGIKDLAGNYPLERFTIIGGSGDNELVAFYYNSYGIFAGDGADVITVGDRDDIVNFAETIKSSDKVVVNGNDEASTWVLMDNIIGFDVSGNATNDLLDLPSSAIAGNTSGFVNGIDAGTIKSHSVSNGIVTFGSADTGVAITINETNRADVITYLAKNLSTPGLTVGIEIDTDSDGSDDSLIVYQPQGGDIEDVAITLTGITGVTLGNIASNDVVQITDSQGPMLTSYPTITSNTITFSFNEVISSYDLTGLSFKHGNGQTLTDIAVTGTSNNANSITLTTDTTFGANDYVLVTVTDKAQVFARDSNSNTAEVFYTDIGFHAAIGGVGNTIIDLSGLTYSDPTTHSAIADLAGGNDTLISGAAGFFELDGGIGNDILDARLSSNADLFGGDGNDVLYGAQHSNEYTGGKGADKITGSPDAQSENLFLFKQGDSTSITFTDHGSSGLGNGDTFTFDGGADIILSGLKPAPQTTYSQVYGDSIYLYSNSYNYLDIDLLQMPSIPLNGLVTDQGYFFQQGSYAEANGIFTVNDTGVDALIVYDGDATAGVSQTALVLANVNAAYLTTDSLGSIYLDPPPMG